MESIASQKRSAWKSGASLSCYRKLKRTCPLCSVKKDVSKREKKISAYAVVFAKKILFMTKIVRMP